MLHLELELKELFRSVTAFIHTLKESRLKMASPKLPKLYLPSLPDARRETGLPGPK